MAARNLATMPTSSRFTAIICSHVLFMPFFAASAVPAKLEFCHYNRCLGPRLAGWNSYRDGLSLSPVLWRGLKTILIIRKQGGGKETTANDRDIVTIIVSKRE